MAEAANEKWWVGYFYTINSVIGSGILAIPWAYYTGGWMLGTICQIIVLFLSIASSHLFLSTWSRMQVLSSLIEDDCSFELVTFSQLFQRSYVSPIKLREKFADISEIKPYIDERKFDLQEIIEITMGRRMSWLVIIAFILGTYPTLAAYFSVFAASLASNVPIFGYTCNLYKEDDFFGECKFLYWTYLLIFGGFLIIVSCFHIKELHLMQITLAIFRFIVVFLMLSTGIIAILSQTDLDDSSRSNVNPEIFNLKNFSRTFFVIMFASLYENTIPTTTGFIKDKRVHLKKVINFSIFTFCSIYLAIGLVLCFAIKKPEEMVTLEWRDYSAGESQDDKPWWSYIIAYTVILLPALDVASISPIVISNFSDNLLSISYGQMNKDLLDRVITMQMTVFKYRMIIIIPSFLLSVFFYNLGSILQASGIFFLSISCFLIPMASLATEKLFPYKSEYDFSDNFLVASLLIFSSIVLMIGCLVSIIIEYL